MPRLSRQPRSVLPRRPHHHAPVVELRPHHDVLQTSAGPYVLIDVGRVLGETPADSRVRPAAHTPSRRAQSRAPSMAMDKIGTLRLCRRSGWQKPELCDTVLASRRDGMVNDNESACSDTEYPQSTTEKASRKIWIPAIPTPAEVAILGFRPTRDRARTAFPRRRPHAPTGPIPTTAARPCPLPQRYTGPAHYPSP